MENKDSIEKNFETLELLIQKMDDEDTTLEESFELYHKGMKLIQKCNEKIDKIEKEIQVIDKGELTDEL